MQYRTISLFVCFIFINLAFFPKTFGQTETIGGFYEDFEEPVDMSRYDVNPKIHEDGHPVFQITQENGALKIVMDQKDFPDGLMWDFSQYYLDLANNPRAQMKIKIEDAIYNDQYINEMPVWMSPFIKNGSHFLRVGGERKQIELDQNGDQDWTKLTYDFTLNDSWYPDSIAFTQYILF